MRRASFDVVVVGGGIGGSSLATGLARAGLDVAVIERNPRFRDRVHGDALAPWGVAEMRSLGLLDALLERADAHWLPTWASYDHGEAHHALLRDVDPHRESILSFHHPRAQSALLELAQSAGATVFRPARLTEVIKKGAGYAGRIDARRIEARLLVGADGLASGVRSLLARRVAADPVTHLVSGVLLAGTRLDPECVVTKRVPEGRLLLFPIGASHTRVYYMADRARAGGPRSKQVAAEILDVCRAELEPAWFVNATAAGPAASFPNACRWVPHPGAEGLVLIGDAAGAGDPSIGQGLSVTVRDVRELSRGMLRRSCWEEAMDAYARERLRYFQTQRMIARWTWELDEPGPTGTRRRSKALRRTRLDRAARNDLMRRIRLDPARVSLGGRARQLVLYG